MRRSWMVLMGLAVAASPTAQSMPSELSALLSKAKVDRPVVAWCRGEFRPGRPSAFAVAAANPTSGGRYQVLDAEGTVVELASYTQRPEVSCYSRAEARQLDATIRHSETIHGQLTPRWNTDVVCAFVDETNAACWQYSPAARIYVKVGGWVT